MCDPIETYYQKGWKQSEAGKRLNAGKVPYNFKLAFKNGYWDHRMKRKNQFETMEKR